MTTIRVSCPDCGAVDLSPSQIRLTVVHGQDTSESYDFRCPSCETRVEKPADGRIAHLLRVGGVEVDEREVLRHPEDPPTGPPLDWDDLLDLRLVLETDDWYDQLVALDA